MATAETRTLLVGDTHGNADWWLRVVIPNAIRESCQRIVQLGDFGYWQNSRPFLDAVRRTYGAHSVEVWFIDGNHEQWPLLLEDAAAIREALLLTDTDPVPFADGLYWAPRGCRIELGGVHAIACGGAVSIDRQLRTAGIDWFIEERINDTDIARIAAAGQAPILFSHDTPSGYLIPKLAPDHALPPSWRAERAACEDHRGRLREVFELVQPQLVVHGHYHRRYSHTLEENWGPVRVEGLDCDGAPPNDSLQVLETDQWGSWEIRSLN